MRTKHVPPRPFVVVISGVSGAGKTTLARALAVRLGDAPCLQFDDYPKEGPGFGPWLGNGAEGSSWQTPELAVHLLTLREGRSISLRDGKGSLDPTEFLVLEDPFGRSRPDIAGLVDFVLYVARPYHLRAEFSASTRVDNARLRPLPT